jgi:hypothetical protein
MWPSSWAPALRHRFFVHASRPAQHPSGALRAWSPHILRSGSPGSAIRLVAGPPYAYRPGRPAMCSSTPSGAPGARNSSLRPSRMQQATMRKCKYPSEIDRAWKICQSPSGTNAGGQDLQPRSDVPLRLRCEGATPRERQASDTGAPLCWKGCAPGSPAGSAGSRGPGETAKRCPHHNKYFKRLIQLVLVRFPPVRPLQ